MIRPPTPAPSEPAQPDRFRGTSHRWTFATGALAGTACDYAFHEDWTLAWRVVAGANQGQLGRAREFRVTPAGPSRHLVTFAPLPGVRLVAAVDFDTWQIAGFQFAGGEPQAFGGSFRVL